MTDPRILECAKSIYDAMDIADGLTPQAAETYARACILKWLEQNVTAAMVDAGFEGLKPRVNQPAKTFTGTTPDAVYTAMCAQAKRELTD